MQIPLQAAINDVLSKIRDPLQSHWAEQNTHYLEGLVFGLALSGSMTGPEHELTLRRLKMAKAVADANRSNERSRAA